MTTTNMFLNFGGKWDTPPLIATPGKGLVKLFPSVVIR